MKQLQHNQWSECTVMAYLEEAASIHRRLPQVKVPGYFSLWPDTLKDDWEQLYDAVNRRTRLGSPMPHEVTYHEQIMDWLRWIDRDQQQIVWMRANRLPWKILVAELGQSKTTLWRQQRNALARIAAKLETNHAFQAGRFNSVSTL
jgi:hypothetical protein